MQTSNENSYNTSYDTIFRFISYFYQIDTIRELNEKNVLEIGIGNRTVSNYLNQNGFKVTTCDIDKNLNPDCVADVKNLPFKDNSFDILLACEVLEHIPFENFERTLKEIYRVTNKYAVISIPYTSLYFEFVFKFLGLNRIFKKPFFHFIFRFPKFLIRIKKSKDHYWEMGIGIQSLGLIRSILQKKFKIIKEVNPILVRHYFFVLEKI